MGHFAIRLLTVLAAIIVTAAPLSTHAGIVFHFEEVGDDVIMTASGSIDTGGLVATTSGSWGGQGVEGDNFPVDVIGNTSSGQSLNQGFAFSDGTDTSAWGNPGGPFSQRTDNYFGDWVTIAGDNLSFATYARPTEGRVAGISVVGSDIVNGIWSIDQVWRAENQSFASLGFLLGSYTVTDAESGEFMTIVVGQPIPIPPAAALMVAGLAALAWRKKRAGSLA